VYVDVLLGLRRGSSPAVYLALALVYFALMGALLFLEERTLILLATAVLLLGLLGWVTRHNRRKLRRALPDALQLGGSRRSSEPPDRQNLN